MTRFLSYLGNHSFGLVYLLFRFPILSNSESKNNIKPKIRPIVLAFDLGFLSW
jgi:hypothetical protein